MDRRSWILWILVAVLSAAVTARSQSGAAAPRTGQPTTTTTEKWEIHLEGGDLSSGAAYVLKILSDARWLPVATTKLEEGGNLCSLFIEKAALPGGCTDGLARVASQVNGSRSLENLSKDRPVTYPNVVFEKYQYDKHYDLRYRPDRVELENDKRIAGKWMNQTGVQDGKFVAHTFDGFKLTVDLPVGATGQRLLQQLEAHPSVFVSQQPGSITDGGARSVPLRSVSGPVQPLVPAWCSNTTQPEQPYARMLGLESLGGRDCAAVRCAEVVLVDTPVAAHPEIAAALNTAAVSPPGQAGAPRCEDPVQLGKDVFHGTHLAGIIASQQNKVAFIGLHPEARLFSISWPARKEAGVADDVQSRRNRSALQIYVFSSQWTLGNALARGDRLKRPENRFRNLVAKKIEERIQDLWIVAAGQPESDPPDDEDSATQIDENLNRGPMNLGDRRNVIVVTGCLTCTTSPVMWPVGNYSRSFVHLAAPADPVVSTGTVDSFTWAQGTSQATAFVAGVASALVSAWPDTYRLAETVKERLQYTAAPFARPQDAGKIAGGVVNPKLAMLNPAEDFLDTTDQRVTAPESVSLEGWCAGDISIKSNGRIVENGEVSTKDVYRIVRMGNEWVVYAARAWDPAPGVVIRVGPGVPVVAPFDARAPESRPLLKRTDGTLIRVSQIEDLVLRPENLTKVLKCE